MKTVLITGIGRGIGYQLARDFALNGYNVIGTVRNQRALSTVDELAKSIEYRIDTHVLELTDFDAIETFSEKLSGQKIDILINCAGVTGGDHQTCDDLDFTEWEKAIKVNTLSPMKVSLSLLPNLHLSENAKIVTISSIMGSLAWGRAGSMAYRSSKAALNKSMQCLALELKPKNIGVYLMHPGWVRTDMGGANADISVEESSIGLFNTIRRFKMEDTGRFWQYDGKELPW